MKSVQTDRLRLERKWLQATMLAVLSLSWNLHATESPAVPAADDGLTIKARTETLTAKPASPRPMTVPVWGSETLAQPETRRPGDLLISSRQPQAVLAKPAADATPPTTQPWTLPIVRLPLMLPSSNITSAGNTGARVQVSNDGKIETREIVAPLPIVPLNTGLNPVRMPHTYGESNTPTVTPPAKP